ncbi:glycosyltransferase family 4 protein [Fulvimarina sp. MAC3]|uniref:glycosyltransferase family 4 protein n=1 Tax=Fulvimarina sp. MAC3 TaxID=3148887 RepID=UPI0031FCEFB9
MDGDTHSLFAGQTVAPGEDRSHKAQSIDRIVIINDVPGAKGGATDLALLSARMLREIGIAVTYISGGDGDRHLFDAHGVQFVGLGGRHILDQGASAAIDGIYNRTMARSVAAWVAANDTPATVYHVHGWSKILSPALFSALRTVAGRLVVHAHDYFLACPNGAFHDYRAGAPCSRVPLGASCLATHCDKKSYAQKLWRSARSLSLSMTFPRSGDVRILMIHEGMKPFLERTGYPENALSTVRNPVRPFTEERVRAEDNRAFLFVGRLVPEKGIEEFLAAARSLAVPVIVVGDGPLRNRLAQEYSDAEFTGWLSREEITQCAERARALVMPTRYPEPFGLVAAEASFSGLPVILSDTALLAGDVVRAGIGFAFESGKVRSLRDAMTRVAGMEPGEIADMSARAYGRTGEIAVSSEAWRDALVNHYREILGAVGEGVS